MLISFSTDSFARSFGVLLNALLLRESADLLVTSKLLLRYLCVALVALDPADAAERDLSRSCSLAISYVALSFDILPPSRDWFLLSALVETFGPVLFTFLETLELIDEAFPVLFLLDLLSEFCFT